MRVPDSLTTTVVLACMHMTRRVPVSGVCSDLARTRVPDEHQIVLELNVSFLGLPVVYRNNTCCRDTSTALP